MTTIYTVSINFSFAANTFSIIIAVVTIVND